MRWIPALSFNTKSCITSLKTWPSRRSLFSVMLFLTYVSAHWESCQLCYNFLYSFQFCFTITWAAKDVSGYSVKFQRYFLRSPYLLSPKSSSFRRSSYFCWHRFSDSISWWILDLFLRNKFQKCVNNRTRYNCDLLLHMQNC